MPSLTLKQYRALEATTARLIAEIKADKRQWAKLRREGKTARIRKIEKRAA